MPLIENLLLEFSLASWCSDGNVIFELHGQAANDTLRMNKNTVSEHWRAISRALLRLQ